MEPVRKISIDECKQAIESRHGGTATLIQSVPVHETDSALTSWKGIVHVFDLRGQPGGAFRAYIFSNDGENEEFRLFSILHSPEIYSPMLAARAAKAAVASTSR